MSNLPLLILLQFLSCLCAICEGIAKVRWHGLYLGYIWYFNVTIVTFWMTFLMNKRTSIVMDDGQNPIFSCDEILSWMIEFLNEQSLGK